MEFDFDFSSEHAVKGRTLVLGTAKDDLIDTLGSGLAELIKAGAGNDDILAGEGDDKIYGGAGDDVIYGEDGDDRIFGGSGWDAIEGGDGNDKMTGGFGADFFFFASYGMKDDGSGPVVDIGKDVITDFKISGANQDVIVLDFEYWDRVSIDFVGHNDQHTLITLGEKGDADYGTIKLLNVRAFNEDHANIEWAWLYPEG